MCVHVYLFQSATSKKTRLRHQFETDTFGHELATDHGSAFWNQSNRKLRNGRINAHAFFKHGEDVPQTRDRE